MPPLSRFLIRLSFGYLVAGTLSGAVLLAGRGVGGGASLWQLLPVHIEFMLFGWMVQLAFGVAHWILPRRATRPGHRMPTGAAVLLNIGILMVCMGGPLPGFVAATGRTFEIAAVALFSVHLLPRIRPFVHPED